MTETAILTALNLGYYNYAVIGNFVFEVQKPVISGSYEYEENGVYYCATATENLQKRYYETESVCGRQYAVSGERYAVSDETLTVLRSYGLTVLRSYGLTVLRSYGLPRTLPLLQDYQHERAALRPRNCPLLLAG
jgi:hypothetical protein